MMSCVVVVFKQWRTFIIDIDLNYSNAADTACESSKFRWCPFLCFSCFHTLDAQ